MSIRQFFAGMFSTLSVSSSELYRYPYRNTQEALQGDSKRIAKDINAVLEQLQNDE